MSAPGIASSRGYRRREGGAALLVCLIVLAALGAASAAALWLARTELWAAGNARAARQALYSAEAGIHHAVALIAPGGSFDALLRREGGLADMADPGPLPFPGGGRVVFPGPPFGYGVELLAAGPASDGSPRIALVSRATAVRGARHAVRAVLGRAVDPYAPAALVVESGEVRVLASAAAEGPWISGSAPGVEPTVAALASVSAAAAAAARRELALAGGRLRGGAAVARRLDVRRFAAETGLPVAPPETLAVSSGRAGASRVAGGATARLVGRGLVLVEGDLTISGESSFEGVLLVAGRLGLPGRPCRLAGLVWAEKLEISRSCSISFEAAAIAAADRLVRLPRLPVVLALEDVPPGG